MRRASLLLAVSVPVAVLLAWLALRGSGPDAPTGASGPGAGLEVPGGLGELQLAGDDEADADRSGGASLLPRPSPAADGAREATRTALPVRVRALDAGGQPLSAVVIAYGSMPAVDPSEAGSPQAATVPAPGSRYVRTEADGVALLRDAPEGLLKFIASKDGYEPVVIAPLDAAALPESSLEIVLHDASGEGWIEILVLQPDGKPCAQAQIQVEYSCEQVSSSISKFADSTGRLRARIEHDCPVAVRANDRAGRFGAAERLGLSRLQREVVLQLTRPRQLLLSVFDGRGTALPRFDARVVAPDNPHRLVGSSVEDVSSQAGAVILNVPDLACVVVVESEGYARAELGPYPVGGVPPELEVRLAALAGISGRVLSGGRPVAGAQVGVHPAYGPDRHATVDDLPVRSQRGPSAHATTDADGVFALTLRESGRVYVRALAEGLAPAEVGPIDYDPARGYAGLEIRMDAGGAIEGLLIDVPAASLQGRYIAASRGDGWPRVARTDAQGRYRLERLTPGRWLVRAVGHDLEHSHTRSSSFRGSDPREPREAPELPWDVEVHAGLTTPFDLDLTARPRVEGELAARTPLPGKWTAELRSMDGSELRARCDIDAAGRFTLLGRAPGAHTLQISAELPGENGRVARLRYMAVDVQLPAGALRWRQAVEFGRLTLRGARIQGATAQLFAPDGAVALIACDGPLELPAAPAGKWTLQGGQASGSAARCELAPGGAAVLGSD